MSAPAEGTYMKAIESRCDTIGWGLLFLLVAALAIPGGTLQLVSVALVGLLMLLLNLARVIIGVPVRWFSVVLGAATEIACGAALAGVKLDIFVLFFALAGVLNVIAGLTRDVRRPAPLPGIETRG